jgi:hypothetical protein
MGQLQRPMYLAEGLWVRIDFFLFLELLIPLQYKSLILESEATCIFFKGFS